MPYIKDERRQRYNAQIRCLQSSLDGAPGGDLNYVISRLAIRESQSGRVRYSDIQEAIGVLECAKLELYRRLGTSVEDRAIESNGDLPEYIYS